ncbi:hypothetical protein BH20ACT11_BH20ACT11_04010 [soil metagenome]|jgi:hypothetical protein
MSNLDFEVGDSVRVKEGVTDPDSNLDISGWHGRVVEISEDNEGQPLILIVWDSRTLQNMPKWYLEESETAGYDWRQFFLWATDIEPAQRRDTNEDVDRVVEEIEFQIHWLSLGEEGRRIQQVLSGVRGEMEELRAWEGYLKENLTFPFEAEVSEHQEKTPLRQGDRVRVWEISIVDDLYGVIIAGRWEGESIDFPLCDLDVVGNGVNGQIVSDYGVWFANR